MCLLVCQYVAAVLCIIAICDTVELQVNPSRVLYVVVETLAEY